MERREVQEDLADVDRVVAWADALAAARGLDDHVRYAIQVCLEEGLANLIVHGRTAEGVKSGPAETASLARPTCSKSGATFPPPIRDKQEPWRASSFITCRV